MARSVIYYINPAAWPSCRQKTRAASTHSCRSFCGFPERQLLPSWTCAMMADSRLRASSSRLLTAFGVSCLSQQDMIKARIIIRAESTPCRHLHITGSLFQQTENFSGSIHIRNVLWSSCRCGEMVTGALESISTAGGRAESRGKERKGIFFSSGPHSRSA